MRWRIFVTTIEGDERLLRDILAEFKISIIEDGAARYLVSERFDVHETPQGARKDAQDVRAVIDQVSSEEPDSKATFTVGNVFEKKADGSWGEHLFIDIAPASLAITCQLGIMATISVTASASDEDRRRIEEENKEREYQRRRRVAVSRVLSAYRDERALQVQRLLRGELTPLALGHIYEIIESDVGDGMTDFASRNQQSRFTRSINHPDVFGGQARHGVSKFGPPPEPMNLDEARNFIRDIAARWMDRKAGI
jgi:hypothetical protein